jgi:hypothetical protein
MAYQTQIPSQILPSKDGSERSRYRRCIRLIGADRVARIAHQNRQAVLAYAGDANVRFATEVVLVLKLADVEAEVERMRKTG